MVAIVARSDQREIFFFSSRRRHTRLQGDWSSDVCSSDLRPEGRDDGVDQRHPVHPSGADPEARPGGRVHPPWGRVRAQIGRASCRERV